MKRLLQGNLGPDGSLDTDAFSKAILTYRNTPDRDMGQSPAQVIFGRVLQDFLLIKEGGLKPRRELLLLQEEHEKAMKKRHLASGESWSMATSSLVPLVVGTVVSVQNQRGSNKTKWDYSGVVVETLPNFQYKVRLDRSRWVTLRNRVFFRRIIHFSLVVNDPLPLDRLEVAKKAEIGVQEELVGSLCPKAPLKPNTGEVVMDSSPSRPIPALPL